MLLGQSSQGIVQLIVREAVTFGGHEQKFAVRGAEKIQELPVTRLWREVGVHQNDAQAERGPVIEIGLNKFRPFPRNLARNLRIWRAAV